MFLGKLVVGSPCGRIGDPSKDCKDPEGSSNPVPLKVSKSLDGLDSTKKGEKGNDFLWLVWKVGFCFLQEVKS